MTLNLTLDNTSAPLFKTVAHSLIEAIEAGRLTAGVALPPTRELADYLNLSRDTVVRAYEELACLGYAEASRTRGTFVKPRPANIKTADQPAIQLEHFAPSDRISEYGERLLKSQDQPTTAPLEALNFGAPPAQFLPLRRWGELLQKHSQSSQLCYEIDYLGLPELRQALATYLRRSRAIPCGAEEIAVFSQSQNALNFLVRLLTNPGDAVVVEEPGFGGIRDIAKGHGLQLVPVPVDHEGMDISRLDAGGANIKLIYVTPAHHDPTGSVMSLERRHALLRFAREHKAWIIEDDYDSNFDYASRPQPSLKTLEPDGNVIYLSTFWKLLYPLSAIGYCVFPRSISKVLVRAKALAEPYSNSLEHLVLVDLLNDGYLERHIRRVQKKYNSRRREFIMAMKKHFGLRVELPKESGAMQYLVRFQGALAAPSAQDKISQSGAQSGLQLISSGYAYMSGAPPGEYIVNFADMDEETIARSVEKFADLVATIQ